MAATGSYGSYGSSGSSASYGSYGSSGSSASYGSYASYSSSGSSASYGGSSSSGSSAATASMAGCSRGGMLARPRGPARAVQLPTAGTMPTRPRAAAPATAEAAAVAAAAPTAATRRRRIITTKLRRKARQQRPLLRNRPIETSAAIRVSLPADAQVFVNDRPTTSTGAERSYVSRGLEGGRTYAYQLAGRIHPRRREGRRKQAGPLAAWRDDQPVLRRGPAGGRSGCRQHRADAARAGRAQRSRWLAPRRTRRANFAPSPPPR